MRLIGSSTSPRDCTSQSGVLYMYAVVALTYVHVAGGNETKTLGDDLGLKGEMKRLFRHSPLARGAFPL